VFGSATDSFSKPAKHLLQKFTYEVRKRFERIRGYYVGPEAHELLKEGKRLTIAEQSPREFDLVLPE